MEDQWTRFFVPAPHVLASHMISYRKYFVGRADLLQDQYLLTESRQLVGLFFCLESLELPGDSIARRQGGQRDRYC